MKTYTFRSSNGNPVCDINGTVVDVSDWDDHGGSPPERFILESMTPTARKFLKEHNENDILTVGFLYRDGFGRLQYAAPLDAPPCPFCHASFEVNCKCYPHVIRDEYGCLWAGRKKLTLEETRQIDELIH